jgi:hypothetical protein
LWKFTDKEKSEIKINSVSKNTKACVQILKQFFASGSVIIGEYSPRLRLGEYSPIITSPSANNCSKFEEIENSDVNIVGRVNFRARLMIYGEFY